MQIPDSIASIFNWKTLVGKIAWAIIMSGISYIWNKYKTATPSAKSSAGQFIVAVIGVVLVLTLVGEITGAGTSTGFQASVLSASPVAYTTNVTITNVSQAPSGIGGAINQNATYDTNGFNFDLVLRVVNSGESSVAWNWKAWVILPNSRQRLPAYIPPSVGANGFANTPFGPLRLSGENNLVQALVTTPLPHGQAIVGWVPIHFDGMKDVLWGTTFILTFEDAFGHVTSVEHLWNPSTSVPPKTP